MRVAQAAAMSSRPLAYTLTPRERDVLLELARSSTYEEVGENLRMSINTVRTHVRTIYEKLDACSRTEAIVSAARHGLLELNALF